MRLVGYRSLRSLPGQPHLDYDYVGPQEQRMAAAADVICELQSEYSRRAYLRDPLFPLTPAILDEAVRFIRERSPEINRANQHQCDENILHKIRSSILVVFNCACSATTT